MFYRYKKNYDDNDNPNFYMSFTDFALTLLITFILLSSLVILNQKNENQRIQKILDEGLENFNIRQKIGKSLKEEFADFPGVTIDEDTGKVTLDSNKTEFYPEDTKLVNEAGTYKFVDEFFPRYIKALKSDSSSYKYIKNITIEGHTAKSGSELRRMELSLQRAFVIYSYINNNRYLYGINDEDFSKIQSVGRGSFELKDPNYPDGAINRRVEFSFVIDEEALIKAFKDNISTNIKG